MARADAPSREVRNILFVCHLNRVRSATAERLFCKRPDLDVRSAGTSSDAMVQVNARMLEWADVVITMDDSQRLALEQMFPQPRRARAARLPADRRRLHLPAARTRRAARSARRPTAAGFLSRIRASRNAPPHRRSCRVTGQHPIERPDRPSAMYGVASTKVSIGDGIRIGT